MANLEKKYYINVGANGTFADSGQVHSTPSDVEDIFKFLNDSDIEKLLIYFHGGLVSEKNGMNAAELMKNYFADVNSKRHVVSFVWETGPIETVVQNLKDLKELTGKDLFEEVIKFVIKIVAKKLGISDARGDGEYLSDTIIKEEKNKVAPFENLDKDLGTRGGAIIDIDDEDETYSEFYKKLEAESKNLLDNEASDELKNINEDNEEVSRGGFLVIAKIVAQIAFAVLKRYWKKTHHDFYPTVMEEAFRKIYLDKIGHWGWKQMKDKSDKMFQSNSGLSGDAQYAGAFFLALLDMHTKNRVTAGKKFEVELIGHSAGSIAICNLLEATGKNFPSIRYNNIFFLAPACRTDLFLEKGKAAKEKGLFQKFKMFTMEESNEKKDYCIPFIYTHSLLYMVSGLFEDEIDAKIMGLHEQFKAIGRYSDFDELKKLNSFINDNKLVLSTDTTNTDESMRSNSLKHGDFDNDDYTLKSILKSI
ncbi:MAG: hypothetical protein A3H98_13445 [Bacteroidetes bacterium RIFCSPLOWO2_02_FULL_36_8]|nr:MAG: hypothetical protein A3H98_13445 [Bacteroidetes bacterium RIFCSPLOWO2_02_FULL_36_8]OFY70189.1 MAG: hypothetical protein A3G23_08560 [Bacteroidetes bacterium RIFCSPLOWO2_12_FULL_37_12]